MRISTRYLQRLLKTSGTSFTAHVVELRLKHAFTLLTAPDSSDVRICDIALQAGFSDISHFNRLFRSRFGDTPTGVRAHARVGSTPHRSALRRIDDAARAKGSTGQRASRSKRTQN
jgi:AraC-like DNA-binding protein